ncbi:hypothetical protein FUAX_14630 [Fulvitalea axinellae]|uniref:Novel STAND NTPase 1 domain-containing protein n=1 Tax=Fulvitalea axinellae TaxID=1182444 RepID=A0AAU9CJD4_9BACT|nr:hypothetical protein FUAX_14630 [Fulvitalea axinellae]
MVENETNEEKKRITAPFVGLRPFQEADKDIFFGRDEYVDNLVGRVRHHRFTAIVGAPNTGKTSLIQAGLIPKLKSLTSERWECVFAWPGRHAFGGLSTAMAEMLRKGSETELNLKISIENELRDNPSGLVEVLRRNGFDEKVKLVIIIDQFEELFVSQPGTDSDREEVRNFVNSLLTVTRQSIYQIHVVVALRTNFLERGSMVAGLSETINQNQHLIPTMSSRDMRLALKKPLRLFDIPAAHELEDRILGELDGASYSLSRLQHTMLGLYRLWVEDKAKDEDAELTEEMYETVGTVLGSIDTQLEGMYTSLDDERKNVVEALFRRLVPISMEKKDQDLPTVIELCHLSESTENTVVDLIKSYARLDRFFLKIFTEGGVDDRLTEFNLTGDSDENVNLGLNLSSRVVLTTNLIIDEWKRLGEWRKKEEDKAEIYLRLTHNAWLHDAGQTGLYKDPELGLALQWKEEHSPEEKWATRYGNPQDFQEALAFLEQSRIDALEKAKAVERQRVRKVARARVLAITIAACSILPIGLAIYALGERKKAVKSENKAMHVMALAEESRNRALRAEKDAISSKKQSEFEKKVAKKALVEAQQAKSRAFVAKKKADRATQEANKNARLARVAAKEAKKATNQAVLAKAEADTFRYRDLSRVKVLETLRKSGVPYPKMRNTMLEAYSLNEKFDGGGMYTDMYLALRKAVKASNTVTLDYLDDNYPVYCVAEQGGTVVTGDERGGIVFYKRNGDNLVLTGHAQVEGGVRSMVFGPDAGTLYCGTDQGEVFLVRIGGGTQEKGVSVKEDLPIKELLWTQTTDGAKWLVALTKTGLHCLDIEPGKRLELVKTYPIPNAVAVASHPGHDDRFILASHGKASIVQVGDDMPTVLKEYPSIPQASCVTCKHDRSGLLLGDASGVVHFLDFTTGRISTVTRHASKVTAVRDVGGNDPKMISVSLDNKIHLVHWEDKSEPIVFDAQQGWLYGIQTTSDNRLFYSVGKKNDVKVWYVNAEDMVNVLKRHRN